MIVYANTLNDRNIPRREIIAAQEDLRGWCRPDTLHGDVVADPTPAMIAKTKGVQVDVDKLISGNETLQLYIDNLTMQMAKRR